jgi:tetratricopeptide (TPR) repeat protein
MDPYDLPEQLSVLQSYDMSKIGFMQDLIRGISKVVDADKAQAAPVKETVVVQNTGSVNLKTLLKRGNMCLEDKDWSKADEYFDRVLDSDAECAEAYLGKALVTAKAGNLGALIPKRIETVPTQYGDIVQARGPDERVIRAAVEKYTKDDQFDFNYASRLKDCEQWAEETEQLFQTDSNLKRAASFADEELKEQLRAAEAQLQKEVQRLMESVRAEDKEKVRLIDASYREYLDGVEQRMQPLMVDAAARYQEKRRQKRRGDIVMYISGAICLAVVIYAFLLVFLTLKR